MLELKVRKIGSDRDGQQHATPALRQTKLRIKYVPRPIKRSRGNPAGRPSPASRQSAVGHLLAAGPRGNVRTHYCLL